MKRRGIERDPRGAQGTKRTLHPMSPSAAQLLREALALNEADRAAVAGALIESLEGKVDSDATDAWETAIRRRVEELDTGAVTPVPWTDVRVRLFSGFE